MLGVNNLPNPNPNVISNLFVYLCCVFSPKEKDTTWHIPSELFSRARLLNRISLFRALPVTLRVLLCSWIGALPSPFFCMFKYFLYKFWNGQFHEILYRFFHSSISILYFSLLGFIIRIFQRLSEIFETFRSRVRIRFVLGLPDPDQDPHSDPYQNVTDPQHWYGST